MTRTSQTVGRIGLTGGIGSGKTTVAEIWRRAGATVIDLDVHSRAVLDVPGPGVEEAIERFGERFRNEQGTIDRQALADLVFGDRKALDDLEGIVLHRVDETVRRLEEEARRAGADVVVHDNPLLFERGRDEEYGVIVAVLAPREQRIARIARDRGRDRGYAESVMAAQVSDLERIRRADRLVVNNGTREQLEERALHALQEAFARLGASTGRTAGGA